MRLEIVTALKMLVIYNALMLEEFTEAPLLDIEQSLILMSMPLRSGTTAPRLKLCTESAGETLHQNS